MGLKCYNFLKVSRIFLNFEKKVTNKIYFIKGKYQTLNLETVKDLGERRNNWSLEIYKRFFLEIFSFQQVFLKKLFDSQTFLLLRMKNQINFNLKIENSTKNLIFLQLNQEKACKRSI